MDALTKACNRCKTLRTEAFTRRDSLSLISKISLSLLFAAATGLAAHVRLPIPGTPVPVTAQVAVVLLGAALLGGGCAALGQVFYLALGHLGIPWFTASAAAGTALLGVTGGYLIGFVPAALFIGLAVKMMPRTVLRPLVISLIMLGGVGIIYLFGAAHFAAFTGAGLHATLAMSVVPFIGWDIAKALIAGAIAAALSPESPR